MEHNDINENFNTLFADNYIIENDIKSMKKHMEKLLTIVETIVENKGELIKQLINVSFAFKIEIEALKQKQNNIYKNIGLTTFCAGIGFFSSFAVFTIFMRKLD